MADAPPEPAMARAAAFEALHHKFRHFVFPVKNHKIYIIQKHANVTQEYGTFSRIQNQNRRTLRHLVGDHEGCQGDFDHGGHPGGLDRLPSCHLIHNCLTFRRIIVSAYLSQIAYCQLSQMRVIVSVTGDQAPPGIPPNRLGAGRLPAFLFGMSEILRKMARREEVRLVFR
jgi:hypothetical protein